MQHALALDPHVVGRVDHDLRDRVIREQALEGSVAEDVVGQLFDQSLAVLARDAGLAFQAAVDLLHDLRPKPGAVDLGGEDLTSQIVDHPEMYSVLHLGERVRPGKRRYGR